MEFSSRGGVPSLPFLTALAVVLLALAALLARPYLAAVVLALLFAFLLHAPYEALARKVRKRSLAAAIVVVLTAVAIFGPVALIVAALAREAGSVLELARDPDRLEATLAEALAPLGVSREATATLIARSVEAAAAFLEGALVDLLASAIHVAASLVIFFFLLFFSLRDGAAAVEFVRRTAPLRDEDSDRLLGLVATRTRAIALGTFLVGLAQGIAGGIGWWIFGFPAPVFWGFVLTVFSVLPFGPPLLIMGPAGLFAILQGDWFAGVGIIVYAAVLVGLVDDVLRPWLVGKQSGVHPAIILVGTLGGLAIFGVSGFVLGPLALGMLGPVLEVWSARRAASRLSG